jgi:protein gp37
MNKTSIEWVRNPDGSQGYTWNPITGCLNHINGLCTGGGFPCYAYKLANGRLKQRYLANTKLAPNAKGGVAKLSISGQTAIEREGDYADPFYPRFWEERLDEPCGILKDELSYDPRSIRPKGIFVCDMSDLFGVGIPKQWTHSVMNFIEACPQHRFYLVTKQPQNLIKFSPVPENCWVGVTATNHEMVAKAVHYLFDIEAKVKFISLEPLLGQLDIWGAGFCGVGLPCEWERINWLIIGAQTNPYKPPEISWVREIVEAADKAGIPVFLKDNLRPLLIPEDCSKPNYLTENIFWASEKALLRQEIPKLEA